MGFLYFYLIFFKIFKIKFIFLISKFYNFFFIFDLKIINILNIFYFFIFYIMTLHKIFIMIKHINRMELVIGWKRTRRGPRGRSPRWGLQGGEAPLTRSRASSPCGLLRAKPFSYKKIAILGRKCSLKAVTFAGKE